MKIEIEHIIDEYGNNMIVILIDGNEYDKLNYEYCSLDCQDRYKEITEAVLTELYQHV